MKWKELLVGAIVALATTACLAETPDWSGGRPAASPIISRGRMLGGQTWWTRYGEPVNSAALEAAPAKGAGVEYAGPDGLHGDGYVYGPNACDCPPPCIDHLWDGYYQDLKRCKPYVPLLTRLCGGANCGGGNCCKNCTSCGPSCSTKAACGCAEPVTCSAPAADCGCNKPACTSCTSCRSTPVLDKCRGLFAHWSGSCDMCSAPTSCGCATGTPSYEASPSDQPVDKQSILRPPVPVVDVSYPRAR